jgi:hypothetical protein
MIDGMDRNLHRYWIKLDPSGLSSDLGYGVTAFTESDALDILRRVAFNSEVLPPVLEVIADVDVRTLDPGHVLPNLNPPNWRGIWFPKGFDSDIR